MNETRLNNQPFSISQKAICFVMVHRLFGRFEIVVFFSNTSEENRYCVISNTKVRGDVILLADYKEVCMGKCYSAVIITFTRCQPNRRLFFLPGRWTIGSSDSA